MPGIRTRAVATTTRSPARARQRSLQAAPQKDGGQTDHQKESVEEKVESAAHHQTPHQEEEDVEADDGAAADVAAAPPTAAPGPVAEEEEKEEDLHHQAPHQKESVEADADVEDGAAAAARRAYEASFPPEPELPRPATTHAVFADPICLRPGEASEGPACPRHLTGTLGGVLWVDADGDGMRGTTSDPTRNAAEYDTGLGGVAVSLADCGTDELVAGTRTVSWGGGGDGDGAAGMAPAPQYAEKTFTRDATDAQVRA